MTNGTLPSITATSRLLPVELTVHGVQLPGLAAKWPFLLHPLAPPPASALTSVVRRIATAACYGRQCRPEGHRSSHGDSVGLPYPYCLSIRSCTPPFFQTTELNQPEQSVGCAPDQDLEPPGSAQDCATAWITELGLSFVYSLGHWDILVLGFVTDCLRVLSLS